MLHTIKSGDYVNIEIDVLAKYVEKLLNFYSYVKNTKTNDIFDPKFTKHLKIAIGEPTIMKH